MQHTGSAVATWGLQSAGSKVVVGLAEACGIFQIRDGTCGPCIVTALGQDVYEEYAAAAKANANSKEIAGGVMYQGDGEMVFVKTVGDSAYFGVFAQNATPAQMEKLIERFAVAPEF